MCKYCEETSCLSEIEYSLKETEYNLKGQNYGNVKSAIARTRMDIRPEDDLWQIDTEVVVLVQDEESERPRVYGEWSDALNINYCPMCGKKLRKE